MQSHSRDRWLNRQSLAQIVVLECASAMGAPLQAEATGAGKSTKGDPGMEATKPTSSSGATGKPASPSGNTGKPVNPEKMADLVIAIMKRAEGNALSTAEIFAQLPENENIHQRQVYNLLYRRAAAGATFVSVGEGKFALRD